jgi:hypothetical protein
MTQDVLNPLFLQVGPTGQNTDLEVRCRFHDFSGPIFLTAENAEDAKKNLLDTGQQDTDTHGFHWSARTKIRENLYHSRPSVSRFSAPSAPLR